MSYWRLGLTLFFALTMSTLVSGTAFKLWFEYDLRVIAQQLKDDMEKVRKKAELDALLLKGKLANQLQKNRSEMEKKRAARSQHQRTCQFWTSEYAKTRASYDLTMKKTAC